jgi:hypothetical protein
LLTLDGEGRGLYIVLVQVGASWRDTWAFGPFTVRTHVPDVRAGARCPGLRDRPDGRGHGRMSGLARAFGAVVFGRISGWLGPDVGCV